MTRILNWSPRRVCALAALATTVVATVAPCLAGPVPILFDSIENPVRVRQVNSDGSGLTTLLTQAGTYSGAALYVDVHGNQIYYSDLGSDRIYRSNLDGTGAIALLNAAGQGIFDLAIDYSAQQLYWADGYGNQIKRSNLDGTGVQIVQNSGNSNFPFALGLDVTNGKMYWTDLATGTIRRSDLSGANMTTILSNTGVRGLALDLNTGKMYWAAQNGSNGVIRSANLDGTGVQTLFTSGSVPAHLALDFTSQKVYWTDEGAFGIRSGNMDGTGGVSLILAGERAYGIHVPEPSTFVMSGLGLIGLAAYGWRRRKLSESV